MALKTFLLEHYLESIAYCVSLQQKRKPTYSVIIGGGISSLIIDIVNTIKKTRMQLPDNQCILFIKTIIFMI